jgi:hypothetical protein
VVGNLVELQVEDKLSGYLDLEKRILSVKVNLRARKENSDNEPIAIDNESICHETV